MLKVELEILIKHIDQPLWLVRKVLKEETNSQVVYVLTQVAQKLKEIKELLNSLYY